MAQVRRPLRHRSPPPRQIPLLPNPIRFRPPTQNKNRSFTQIENRNSHNKQYDPVTGLMVATNNSEQSLSSIVSSSNQLITHEQQPSFYETNPPIQNNNMTEESLVLPAFNENDDGVLDKKHLPVYAQFPFNTSFLPPQPMDTNVEDNIHKLRLRLIDSELNHQRRSTDEYIKRTQDETSPTPTEYYVHNVRPPSELVRQQVVPRILSRQPSLSMLPDATSSSSSGISRDRIGMDNDLQNSSDLERELEIRRIQESLKKRRRSTQQSIIPNYSHDPRLHLQPLNEEQFYTSSNMDDLIDSMARRHLAYRRLDAAVDQQRRSNGFHGPYTESLNTGRASLRNQQQNDDLLHTNRSARGQIERDPTGFNQMLRSRIDYYNRIQPDSNGNGFDDSARRQSYTKLPPISSGYDSNRYNHLQNPSTSTLYETKHDSNTHRNHSQILPLNFSDQSEHSIELPSDIFISSRMETLKSPQRTHKTRQRSISKDRRSGSDVENEGSTANRHDKNSQNVHHGFIPESNIQQKKKTKYRRNLFKNVAIGVLFLISLKHRAAKNRSHRSNQSPSATIHKIRLQEIIVALHRVYLEPDGPIYNALIQATTNSTTSLQDALNNSSKNYSEAIKLIGSAVKNVISKIVEFMPRDGVLGTSKTSAVSALIQDGNPFPENYFWQCERELLEFDHLKIINITKQRAILLLIGIFIYRALVTTLLIKPIKYRLILGQLTQNQSVNLKILASVILYIGRRAAGANSQILALPHEWQLSLYTDADIETIIQHSEIKSIVSTCEQSLRIWCEEYIRRIDASFDKELRI